MRGKAEKIEKNVFVFKTITTVQRLPNRPYLIGPTTIDAALDV